MSPVCKLYDLATNELADISDIALEKTLTRRLNLARGFTITAPAGHSLLTTASDDGFPNLETGDRKLIVWEDPDEPPIFHGRCFTLERHGDGNENLVTATFFDPRMELGYQSEDRAGRLVRDSTGNFIDPTFTPSVSNTPATAISGPDLIKQAIENSVQVGDESDSTPGEGPLPIDLTTGDFDLLSPPAIDLSPGDLMDWPLMLGDFIAMLVETNVVDVDMRPVDPTEGLDDYVMVALSAVSSFGTDRSGTVHFDYWTGSKNAKACRYVEDFQTVCNKLYDYLGPRRDQRHWRGNITPGSPGTSSLTTAIAASRARYGGPGSDKGSSMSLRTFDSLGDENASRPLYLALWLAEQGLRLGPRTLLHITPNPDSHAVFDAPSGFDTGDLIAVNVGEALGIELAAAQRVYGYDKTWDRQGVARLSELLTSADGE